MIKFNTQHQPLNASYGAARDLKNAQRLIVPIQDPEADLNPVARRVWELASATGADIKFIGFCNDSTKELSLRRTLTTLSAMVNDEHVCAEFELVSGRDFLGALKSRLQSGDTVVYWRDSDTGLLRRSANSILQADLGTPVYFLSGLASPVKPHSDWLRQVAAWFGFLIIIAGFFWLQVEIGHLEKIAAMILQVLSIGGEVGLVWIWNSLLG
jgi:hypothetical protein